MINLELPKGNEMKEVQSILKSKIGNIYISANNEGLTGVSWHNLKLTLLSKNELTTDRSQIIKETRIQIHNYLHRKLIKFTLPFILNGTPFQKSVWHELMNIPFGKTASYSDIASRIGKPNAVRAVGTANSKNTIAIIIPCHRVISKGGDIAGYAGGVETKRALLQLENL
jgi:methylated-DNA-[protein]-cysteine S-methyltransferase